MKARTKRRPRDTVHSRRRGRLSRGRVYRYALTLALAALLFSPVAMVGLPMPDVRALRSENPKSTDRMRRRAAEGDETARAVRRMQSWVPLERISADLRRAVVLSQDSAFLDDSPPSRPWRRSPITRRLAANLYFSGEGNALRAAARAITAFRLERALPRERILELYLNVAEWGDGVYGAGAAARHYFGREAGDLTRREAALLASSLDAPRESDPSRPTRELTARAERLERRLNKSGGS